MILLELFLTFFKVGCFTFGGGYAAISLIRDAVLEHGWLTEESLAYMIAVSESTPGPIMVNMATYVGSSQGGALGALLATLAVVLPSFCIILLIMALMKNIIKNVWVQTMLAGMQPCIIGIILAAGVNLSLKAIVPDGQWDLRAAAIGLVLVGFLWIRKKMGKKKTSPIQLILLSGILGMVVYGI